MIGQIIIALSIVIGILLGLIMNFQINRVIDRRLDKKYLDPMRREYIKYLVMKRTVKRT